MQHLLKDTVKKAPSSRCEDAGRCPARAVYFSIEKDKERKGYGETDEVNRREKPKKPGPDLQVAPATLVLESRDLKSGALGLRTLPTQSLKIENKLNQRQDDPNASQKKNHDGGPDRPILGYEKGHENNKAYEGGEENPFDSANHCSFML